MKFIFSLIFITVFTYSKAHANSEMILITYNQHEQMAKWLQTVISGPNINTPDSLVEILQVKNPCVARSDHLMHICVDSQASYKVVVMKSKEIEEAFAHLVPEQISDDPVARQEWQKIWEKPEALKIVAPK